MPEIPSFFNSVDFFGKLLPGYVAVTLAIVLFQPNLLVTRDQIGGFDLLSAIVFIIAGPMVGYTLQLVHRYLYSIAIYVFHRHDKEKSQEFVKSYARVRLNCSADEKSELDRSEYGYDFAISTAIALILISTFYSVYKWTFVPIFIIPVIFLTLVLLLGAYFQKKDVYTPLIRLLLDKYK
jgi:hypothetical protein